MYISIELLFHVQKIVDLEKNQLKVSDLMEKSIDKYYTFLHEILICD